MKLKAKFPASLVEMTRIPGVGAKTVRRIYDETGIATLEELSAAAEAGDLRGLKGLGPKFEENVLNETRADGRPTVRRSDACSTTSVRSGPSSSPRWRQAMRPRRSSSPARHAAGPTPARTSTSSPPRASRWRWRSELAEHPLIDEAGNPTENGLRARTHNGIAVDLRIVPPDEFGNLLQHFTGSKGHNVKLRERAVKMGLSVSEHGIAEAESGDGHQVRGRDRRLRAPRPRLHRAGAARGRAARSPAAEAGELPELVTIADIRGELHCHTTLSDGKNTLEEMAEAARARGYAYLAITDHSASHGFGDDVQPTRAAREGRGDRRLQRRARQAAFRLLAGSEVNISTDGSLDYADDAARRSSTG